MLTFRSWRRWALPVLTLGLAYALAETTAWVGLRALRGLRSLIYTPISTDLSSDQANIVRRFLAGDAYLVPDTLLGWSIRPNAVVRARMDVDPLPALPKPVYANYRSTAQQLRGDRWYDTLRAPDMTRWAAFGDSFVHGDETDEGHQWTRLLEADHQEVMNFGVPGFGFDQAYLRYQRDGRRFHPSVVLIGVYPEDVPRGVNVWHPFYDGNYGVPSAKPRFELDGDSLRLLPNPLATGYEPLLRNPTGTLTRIGEADYFYQVRERAGPFDRSALVRLGKLFRRIVREQRDGLLLANTLPADSPPVRLALATLDAFAADVRADGATPILVIFPARIHLMRFQQSGIRVTQAISDHALRVGLRTVDLHDCFAQCDAECIGRAFAYQGHYSAEGNRMIADYLRRVLADLTPTPPAMVR